MKGVAVTDVTDAPARLVSTFRTCGVRCRYRRQRKNAARGLRLFQCENRQPGRKGGIPQKAVARFRRNPVPSDPPFTTCRAAGLVGTGPFRLSRNPMYLGMASALTGLGILLGSVLPFLVLPAFMLVIQRMFIVHEEAQLAERFGAEFEDNSRRVRRWR